MENNNENIVNAFEEPKNSISKEKTFIKGMLNSERLDTDTLKAYFTGYNERLPEFFVAFTEIVKGDQKATESIIHADQQSTTEYIKSLNQQLEFLIERSKAALTEQERADLFKQTEEILNREREEKREQREYTKQLNEEQKKQNRFFAGSAVVVASVGVLGISIAVNPERTIKVAKEAIRFIKE
ncbi:hypothetical protein SAMN04488127_2552 [Bhargavaea ginsengi]|uniref:Uncharacterized protein n=1 Tax=Bhargavaea ginsengi TaxID=426757 RepID=A0A1H7AZG1_9BACL|nr:hypothetical protein [Bhargavaea ginsengi]SEJ70316.1 hypothetical protein SAMN04488127_2552 [Bhargavaea ginsengi]